MAGFTVASPRDPEDTAALAVQRDFDAVVIGHSVAPKMRSAIIEVLRRCCPNRPILFVYTGDFQSEPLADASLDVTGGAQPLIDAIREKLERSQAA